MSIWTIVSMFFTFIRELLFDSKEEFDYRSSKFNSRKVTLYVVFIVLFVATVLSVNRVYKQSAYLVQLKDAIVSQEIKRRREHKELLALRAYVDSLPQQVKKTYPVPSDSGNSGFSNQSDDKKKPEQPQAPKMPDKALPPNTLVGNERREFIEKFLKGEN